MKRLICILLLTATISTLYASTPLRNEATENLYAALKHMTRRGYTMFGMANALTISYHENKKQAGSDITSSDIKEVTGDNPAFVESDLMWYSDKAFRALDIRAMKLAHARGAVVGYCWHLGGMRSGSFAVQEGGAADSDLAARIVANADRRKNAELDWYLTLLDTLAIPVFRELEFPLVFRPFHEMTGNWFWWGSDAGRETYIQLFHLTVDYLREKGIDNLLYCWSPDKDADFGYYPGDDYVDVIGFDAYEPGLMPYITSEILTRELSKLVAYADNHDKVAAWTEVGLRTEKGAAQYAYPTRVPDFWSKYVWDAVKAHPATQRLAWIMTWYNADWRQDGSGAPFVPYSGMQKEGSEAALADFQKLYHTNEALFEQRMPPMYASASDYTLFVRPQRVTLRRGERITMLGGRCADWYRDTQIRWQSADESVATVDPATGEVQARRVGTTTISLTRDGKSASAHIAVVD